MAARLRPAKIPDTSGTTWQFLLKYVLEICSNLFTCRCAFDNHDMVKRNAFGMIAHFKIISFADISPMVPTPACKSTTVADFGTMDCMTVRHWSIASKLACVKHERGISSLVVCSLFNEFVNLDCTLHLHDRHCICLVQVSKYDQMMPLKLYSYCKPIIIMQQRRNMV